MKVKDALKGYSMKMLQSERNKYENTETNICWLSLSNGTFHDQDYLVMSKASTQKMLSLPEGERKEFLGSCEVVYSEEAECWGIVCPVTSSVLFTYDLSESEEDEEDESYDDENYDAIHDKYAGGEFCNNYYDAEGNFDQERYNDAVLDGEEVPEDW